VAGGVLSFPAQVVWCTVIGRHPTRTRDAHLDARNGLRFTALTAGQQAARADTLHALATALQPIA
jgi:hypothetical protein